MVIQRKSSILGAIGSRSREVKREVKNPLHKNYWTNLIKFGGKIHNCDTKKGFDFGSDRLKVKVKRGQKVKRGKKTLRENYRTKFDEIWWEDT